MSNLNLIRLKKSHTPLQLEAKTGEQLKKDMEHLTGKFRSVDAASATSKPGRIAATASKMGWEKPASISTPKVTGGATGAVVSHGGQVLTSSSPPPVKQVVPKVGSTISMQSVAKPGSEKEIKSLEKDFEGGQEEIDKFGKETAKPLKMFSDPGRKTFKKRESKKREESIARVRDELEAKSMSGPPKGTMLAASANAYKVLEKAAEDQVKHYGKQEGTKDPKGSMSRIKKYKTKGGKIKNPPKGEKKKEDMAGEMIAHHMHHLGRHPGGEKQAIAIGLNQAGMSRKDKSMKTGQDKEMFESKSIEKSKESKKGNIHYKAAYHQTKHFHLLHKDNPSEIQKVKAQYHSDRQQDYLGQGANPRATHFKQVAKDHPKIAGAAKYIVDSGRMGKSIESLDELMDLSKAMTARMMPSVPRPMNVQYQKDIFRSAMDIPTNHDSKLAKDIPSMSAGYLKPDVLAQVRRDEEERTHREMNKGNEFDSCDTCGRTFYKSLGGCPTCTISKAAMCKACGHQMVKGKDGQLRCSICG